MPSSKFHRALLLIILGILPVSLVAQTKSATDDPILAAMKAEMARSKEKLKLPDLQAPYYIEYSVADTDRYSAATSFGALTNEQRSQSRVLSIVVRVGDYKQDN